jgi:hypothetical protein
LSDLPDTIGALLDHLGDFPEDTLVTIEIRGQDEKWSFTVKAIKNILMRVLFDMPDLRKRLSLALKDVETLQEQIAGVHGIKGETLTVEPPKWEYSTIQFNPRMNYITKFSQLGDDGWELVQMCFEKNDEFAVFKRPL